MPQGGVGSSASVAIAMASNERMPRATAVATAARSAQMPAGNDAFSTLHPSVMLPSAARSAAPTRKFEYGAYARVIAPCARSRSIVVTRSSPPAVRPSVRGVSVAILRGEKSTEEGAARATKRNAEPVGNGRPEIGECVAAAERTRHHTRSEGEHRHALSRVIGGRRRRIVAVVGRDEQQIVLPQRGKKRRKRGVELTQRLVEPRSVVSVPKLLVEIYKVGEQQPTRCVRKPLADRDDPIGVAGGVLRV